MVGNESVSQAYAGMKELTQLCVMWPPRSSLYRHSILDSSRGAGFGAAGRPQTGPAIDPAASTSPRAIVWTVAEDWRPGEARALRWMGGMPAARARPSGFEAG